MLSKTSKKDIQLFNIMNDPTEGTEVSAANPEIVDIMIEKLQDYAKGMVKSQKPGVDLQADPKFHKGFWQPWI